MPVMGYKLPAEVYILFGVVAVGPLFGLYSLGWWSSADPELSNTRFCQDSEHAAHAAASSAGFYQDSEHAAAVSEHYRHGPVKRFFEAHKGDRDTWGVFDNRFSAGQNKIRY